MMAYIDPGSGTILLQLLIGSLVGAGLYFRRGLGRLLHAFRRNRPTADSACLAAGGRSAVTNSRKLSAIERAV